MNYTLLSLAVLFLASWPYINDLLFTPTFKVHETGAVVITGASSGIGLDAALELDRLGYTVFPGVRKDADAKALKEMSSTLRPLMIDTTDSKSCEKAAKLVESWLLETKQGLVGVVNNAGISRRIPLELENIDAVEHQGRIVSTGSVAGLIATAGSATYSASKYAVEGITDSLRLEMAPFGVSVSVVEPAYVKSKIASKQVGENAPILKSPAEEDAKALYNDFLSKQDKKRIKAEEKASTTSESTTPAIVHALTSPKPKTRYIVANYFGLPAWILGWVHYVLPDRVEDLLITTISSR
ncbi:hypothetical protein TrRE_jg9451 [Triparma retinervis]|uniref:Ketoreductase domain-containing protein n=1 Tax=Triparma retinervis TaxID=2557542 RepID=A0A9W7AED2_9STRA|nr:hypothetical protein TrRE_jg9451 [Triparma retinervis]